MKEIPLTQGYVALVDDEDHERVSQYRWQVSVRERTAYAITSLRDPTGRYVTQLLHRFLLEPPPDAEVDHRDGNGLNCCRVNMRLATRMQQGRNRRGWRASGIKGVAFHKRRAHLQRPWEARLFHEGKILSLGYFANELDAAHAYDRKARELFGEFARLNFPEEAA